MVELDYCDNMVGNALKMALGLKSIAWQREQGLAKVMASSCAIRTDSLIILGEESCIILLEESVPEPSLFPNGNRGMPMALSAWRDKISTRKDAYSLAAHATLVIKQIHDGRDYLQGNKPGLADIQSAAWIFETELESNADTSPMLKAWCQRMRAFLEPSGTDNFVVPFLENTPHQAATIQEFNSDLGSLTLSVTGQSDMLIHGILKDDNRIITSPLSHRISM